MQKWFAKKTDFGIITIVEDNEKIVKLFLNCNFDFKPDNAIETETKLLKNAFSQLEEYFQEKRFVFDLPLCPVGTDFQKKVWKELLKIPYGHTASYQKIAENIGNIKACRAVGMANNKNPIPIFIPCHRVIGKNDDLTGYEGGLDFKKRLLNLEKTIS